jgi:hypothetical protein
MQILKGNNIKALSDLKEKELRQAHKLIVPGSINIEVETHFLGC